MVNVWNKLINVLKHSPGAGPEDTADLAGVFSIDRRTSRVVFIYPTFRMGLKPDEYKKAKAEGRLSLPSETYHYRGATSAMTAFGATKGLIALLGKFFDPDELQSRVAVATEEETESLVRSGAYTHYILMGTRSHLQAIRVLAQYSPDFEFNFDKSEWSVIDKRTGEKYSVPNPSEPSLDDQTEGKDYALVEKIVDPLLRKVIIFIGGMWDTGTLAAGAFLIAHRKQIFEQFGSGGFQYLLEVTPGSTHVQRIVLERSPLLPDGKARIHPS